MVRSRGGSDFHVERRRSVFSGADGQPMVERRQSMSLESQAATVGHEGRRERTDRRQAPTSRFSRYALFGGRRKDVRREEEREGSFVDVHGFKLWCILLWVALMNIGDSYFTLVHLQAGGIEPNPVAQALLGTGRLGFVIAKSLLIGLALIVLALHKNFFLARIGLWTAAGTYTLLVLYHLSLFRVQ